MPKPANMAAFRRGHSYLRENGIVPKCVINSILFLLTPAGKPKLAQWRVAMLARLNSAEDDSPLAEVLPGVYGNVVRYRDHLLPVVSGDARLCPVSTSKDLQKSDFPPAEFPVSGDRSPGCTHIFAVKVGGADS